MVRLKNFWPGTQICCTDGLNFRRMLVTVVGGMFASQSIPSRVNLIANQAVPFQKSFISN